MIEIYLFLLELNFNKSKIIHFNIISVVIIPNFVIRVHSSKYHRKDSRDCVITDFYSRKYREDGKLS